MTKPLRARARLRVLAATAIAIVGVVLVACGGGSKDATLTAAPTGVAVASPSGVDASPQAPSATGTPRDSVLGNPSVDGRRAYDTVRKLAVEIGPRVAGTAGEIAARDYLKATLENYGYDVTVQDFGFDATAYLPARVDVSGSDALPAIAMRGSGAGSASGRIVVAGIGKPDEYPASGARGAIALVQRGELTFTQKVTNAIAAGASGVIVYNNEDGRLVGDLAALISVPAVGITKAAGEQLVARVAAGTLDGTITVSPPKGTAYNVIAKPRGVRTCATLTGGHYDSVAVTGGADDNASGAASVVELARVVAAQHVPGANCFALFSAEEFGLFGSKAYVEQLSDADRNAMRGMINLDVVGIAAELSLIGSPDLIDVARLQARAIGIDAIPSTLPTGAGSDHLSFQNAGIPVVMLYRDDQLIHTPQDDINRIEVDSLAATVRVAQLTMQRIAAP